jgi:hypothetical protein
MTFAPVLPPLVLLVVAVGVIGLRLLNMRRLHASGGARWATVWRWSGLTLAVLLILIAGTRPGIDNGERGAATARPAANTNVFLLVDRSADSAITDYGDGRTRMSAIRNDIQTLIDRYPQSRFALIAFAARPSLDWPLSEDAWSLKPEVTQLAPYPPTDEDVNAAAAANVLRYQLIAAGQQYPNSKSLVFYFGSGAAGSRAPQGEFDPTPNSVDGGGVFGYGAAQNEPGLRRVAEQLGVPYVDRDDGTPISQSIPVSGSAQPAAPVTTASGVGGRSELYWIFTLLAAVLLLFEVFASIRDIRRTRLARRNVTL